MAKWYYFLNDHSQITSGESYHNAKNHNDYYAASKLINLCVDDTHIKKFTRNIPDNTILLPITSNGSTNIIPQVFADIIKDSSGKSSLSISMDITCKKVEDHTSRGKKNMGTLRRILTPPIITGNVIKGANYLLVDDVATSGTTLKSVSNYIRRNGGNVIAYSTLAKASNMANHDSPIDSIDVNSTTITKMLDKFSMDETVEMISQFKDFGYKELEDFCDEDFKYILKFKNPDNLRAYIDKQKIDIGKDKLIQIKNHYEKIPTTNINNSKIDPNKETIKLIVAGGRDYRKYGFLQKRLNYLLKEVKKTKNVIILSGGASGADKLGEFYAKTHGYSVIKHIPKWEDYPNKEKKNPAGVIRNKEMAREATHLVAFWDERSKGTKDMIIHAVDKKLTVRVFNYNNRKINIKNIKNNNNQLNFFA